MSVKTRGFKMTEEIKKDRTPEEMWADWARKEITDQETELKELRRFKREKELRRFKKYSAALEKEVKTLLNALDQIRITLEAKKDGIVPTRFNLDFVDGYMMLSIVTKALKAK